MEPRLDRLFTIGGFAEQTGISAKSLRRYDRSGLLVPARVDPDTGYRLYSAAQLDDAARLRLLRDLDVPLAEIADLMRGDDLERTRDVLRHHRDRMRERQTRVESILTRIERLVGEELGLLPYAMEMADYDACTVVSARTVVRLEEIDETVDGLAARLRDSLAGHGLVEDGREFSLMHNVMTWYDGADVEVCLPVAPPPPASPPAHLLPAFTAVRTVCHGPWSDLAGAYAALLAWTARHGCEVCGPARELYRVDYRDTSNPDEYRTELALPVSAGLSALP
jgi:DNA-binding transcriptional MerR regulator